MWTASVVFLPSTAFISLHPYPSIRTIRVSVLCLRAPPFSTNSSFGAVKPSRLLSEQSFQYKCFRAPRHTALTARNATEPTPA
jgi:hypothetical protein